MNSQPGAPDHVQRVLIVDDERPNRQVLEAMLTPESVEISTAASGEEALAHIAVEPPDLILLDVMMPGMNGYDVARTLKGSAATQNIPIIMITALGDRDARMRGLGAGAEDFLSKPVDRAELCVRVRNLLRLKAYSDYYGNYSEMLERKVEARTAELADRTRALETQSAALRQAQKMEAIGQMAGGVAHDFNNLLTVISSYAELMMQDADAAGPLRDDIQQVINAATSATALTRQLLAFSRKDVVQPTNVDVNGLVAGMEPMLGRLIGHGKKLSSVLSPELGIVRADKGQLEQVLMNLVVNARDATEAGGMLAIETANLEVQRPSGPHDIVPPGSFVTLAVRDNGTGMDEATKERLFEPFFTTKEPGRGTGLGLATVYGIVKQSGGYIRVDSAPGAGATFTVLLPRATQEHLLS